MSGRSELKLVCVIAYKLNTELKLASNSSYFLDF